MLTSGQIMLLRRAGFLDFEIKAFHWAVTPDGRSQHTDISSPVWLSARRTRKEWVEGRRKAGWKDQEIRDALMRFYTTRGKFDPFEWLKLEYRPPAKAPYKAQKRARRKVQSRLKKVEQEHRRGKVKELARTKSYKEIMVTIRQGKL